MADDDYDNVSDSTAYNELVYCANYRRNSHYASDENQLRYEEGSYYVPTFLP